MTAHQLTADLQTTARLASRVGPVASTVCASIGLGLGMCALGYDCLLLRGAYLEPTTPLIMIVTILGQAESQRLVV